MHHAQNERSRLAFARLRDPNQELSRVLQHHLNVFSGQEPVIVWLFLDWTPITEHRTTGERSQEHGAYVDDKDPVAIFRLNMRRQSGEVAEYKMNVFPLQLTLNNLRKRDLLTRHSS